MIHRVKISFDGEEGFVEYDEDLRTVRVEIDDPDVAAEVMEHLTTPRLFRIPESDQIDDYREEGGLPIDNIDFFRLSMCTLFAQKDIYVHW